MSGRTAPLIAFILGALTVAGYAPLYLYLVPIATVCVAAWQWEVAPTRRRAAWLGWWFGLGFFLTGVSWVYVSLHTFGAMPAPLAALATVLFCAYLALHPAVIAWLVTTPRLPRAVRLLLVMPVAWTIVEWIREWLFTGFPWLALGYSQIPDSPLAGYAPLLGIGGVTFATALSSGLLLALLLDERLRASLRHALHHAALYALPLLWIAGYALLQIEWTAPIGPPLAASLLQGNIPQDVKWTPGHASTTLEAYRRLALASKSPLIVMPETALPLFIADVPQDYLSELADHARANHGDMLIGVPEGSHETAYYNSVVSLGSSSPQVYRKRHLVPFGEFIPLRPVLGWIVSVLAIPLQDFSRGAEHPQPLEVAGQRVAVNICYEDAFGEEIMRQLPAATLLVNASNVAWFGRSIAPYQHLQISQARALETGRYMLRATNTGITGVIDAKGRVLAVAPQFAEATVTHEVQGYAGATPYVRVGNYAVLALCALLAAIAWLMRRPRH